MHVWRRDVLRSLTRNWSILNEYRNAAMSTVDAQRWCEWLKLLVAEECPVTGILPGVWAGRCQPNRLNMTFLVKMLCWFKQARSAAMPPPCVCLVDIHPLQIHAVAHLIRADKNHLIRADKSKTALSAAAVQRQSWNHALAHARRPSKGRSRRMEKCRVYPQVAIESRRTRGERRHASQG